MEDEEEQNDGKFLYTGLLKAIHALFHGTSAQSNTTSITLVITQPYHK